jgi:hypothetical protein
LIDRIAAINLLELIYLTCFQLKRAAWNFFPAKTFSPAEITSLMSHNIKRAFKHAESPEIETHAASLGLYPLYHHKKRVTASPQPAYTGCQLLLDKPNLQTTNQRSVIGVGFRIPSVTQHLGMLLDVSSYTTGDILSVAGGCW